MVGNCYGAVIFFSIFHMTVPPYVKNLLYSEIAYKSDVKSVATFTLN